MKRRCASWSSARSSAGIDFLVPCGTTGESPTLTHKEHLRVVEITVEEAQGQPQSSRASAAPADTTRLK